MRDFAFFFHLSFIITEEPLGRGVGVRSWEPGMRIWERNYALLFSVFTVSLQGDVSGSLAEFDKAIEMDPRQRQCMSS